MFEELRTILTILTLLGCGLMAGVFFAFSAFVMKALARLPAAEGMAAMQSVNRAVINPVFLGVFLGTAVACLLELADSFRQWRSSGSVYLLAGCLLYLIGTFGVTMFLNVPLNNALVAVEPAAPDSDKLWADYQTKWTAWNHVRAVASLLASGLFALALRG